MQKDVLAQSLGRAAATTAYIALIAAFLSNAERLFGQQENEFLIPIFMLMLFVISGTTLPGSGVFFMRRSMSSA